MTCRTAETQLPELDGADAMAEEHLASVDTYQAGADELLTRHQELSAQATEADAQQSSTASKTGEATSMIGTFAGPFIGLMGRVPSHASATILKVITVAAFSNPK